jgi:hypothetical protein
MDRTELVDAYLNLLRDTLTDIHNAGKFQLTPYAPGQGNLIKRFGINTLINTLAKKRLKIISDLPPTEKNYEDRVNGMGWPLNGFTMIGTKRMNNVRYCVEDVLKNSIEGDLIETGVWRGGATIYMKAILAAHGDVSRKVWVADSFEGLPKPNTELYPEDEGDDLYSVEQLRVTQNEVESNFKKFNLLDERVGFLKGWFKDTLPKAPMEKLSVIRLDGDMYESTMDGLVNLYPKLSIGGYIIIDDYGAIPACAKAVSDYRDKMGITEEIKEIDWSGRFWQRLN